MDLTSVVLGPLATRTLGDFGAEVIKVESPEGDVVRANGVSRNPGMSSIFLALNRNKRSLAVDLKTSEGREVLLKLAATADVLVHNMRPSAMARLGLSYEAVRAINPGIVYCVASGFGQSGPDANRPAFDDIIQASCGLADLMTGEGDTPQYAPTLVADKTAGMALAQAVLAALYHRSRTGEGQHVEVPMFETLVDFMLVEHMGGMAFNPTRGLAGYGRILGGGRRPVRTADGYIAIMPYVPAQWQALLRRIGAADLIDRYDISDRHKLNGCVRDLYRELSERASSRTSAEWLSICDELDIAAAALTGLDQLPEHPHLKSVALFNEAVHPTEGPIRYIRPTTLFGATPAAIRRHAPHVGEHTQEILASLGYSEDELQRLRKSGVVTCCAATPAAPASAPEAQALT